MSSIQRLSLVLAIACATPACSWYFGPDDDESDATTAGTTGTTTDTDTTGDPGTTTDTDTDTTGEPDPDDCLNVNAFLSRFGSCLSFTEWSEAGLCGVAVTSAGDGNCADCHSEGEQNVYLSLDCLDTFEAQRSLPFVLTIIDPFSDRDGCYVGLRVGGGRLLMPEFEGEHPDFELPDGTSDALIRVVNNAVGRTLDETVDCSMLE